MNRRKFLSALAVVPVAASLPAKAAPVPKVVNVAGYDCMTTYYPYREFSRGFSVKGDGAKFSQLEKAALEHNNRRVKASGWKVQLRDIC